MNITKIVSGVFEVNTYIVTDGMNTVIIDPACEIAEPCDAVLLTHGHFDHTTAAAKLNVPIYIHENDAEMLDDIDKSFGALFESLFNPCQAEFLFKDGDVLEFGALRFKVMHTPGHSKGSVMFICGDSIFTGDTLFAGSAGRIDGYGGDHDRQMESMAKIAALDGEYKIFPGHGAETDLEHEKRTNPFLL
jgi:glyoxylase-like metal-dependent hydrolase (beta-lactamase superfamily II)